METFNEQHAVETYKSLIAISTEGFRALQLLNGGAIVALLTYLGHLTDPAKAATKAAWPMKHVHRGACRGHARVCHVVPDTTRALQREHPR